MTFEDASAGRVQSRLWDFGDGTGSRNRRIDHAWSSPGFYEVTLTVTDGTTTSTASQVFLVEAAAPLGTCEADAETLCLQDSRYAVAVEWRKSDGTTGAGSVVHAGTNDSGLFTFFNRENWEDPDQGAGRLRGQRPRVGVRRVDDGPWVHDPGDGHRDGRGEGVPERAGAAGARDH